MDSLHTQMEFIESFEDLIDLEIIEPSIGDDSCINFEQYFDTDIHTRQNQESLLEEDEVKKEITLMKFSRVISTRKKKQMSHIMSNIEAHQSQNILRKRRKLKWCKKREGIIDTQNTLKIKE